jgi:hypothetical protein
VDLPSTSEQQVLDMFHASVSVELGNGRRCYFWTDRWLQGSSIKELAPNLFKAVSNVARRRRLVAEGIPENKWVSDIVGALTLEVLHEFLVIWDLVQDVNLIAEREDAFIWKWTSSKIYSASSAYNAFFHGRTALLGAPTLWKTKAPHKCKFFGWSVLHARCWTSARLHRHGLADSDSCSLCDQHAETHDHLLLHCVYSKQIWFKLLRRASLSSLWCRDPDASWVSWWLSSRKLLTKDDRKAYDTLVLLAS